MLNLKQVMQVAACAAIIALGVGGAGLLASELAAEREALGSPAVAYQHESCPVKRMAAVSSLHQLQCRLSQGFCLCRLCCPGFYL